MNFMSFDIFIIYKASIKYVLRDTRKRNIEKLCKLSRSLSFRKIHTLLDIWNSGYSSKVLTWLLPKESFIRNASERNGIFLIYFGKGTRSGKSGEISESAEHFSIWNIDILIQINYVFIFRLSIGKTLDFRVF